jgi:Tol biopolymer transport system component
MRTIAGALALLFVAIAQRDPQRTFLDPPSVAISADGRYVAFTSYERLAPADTNDCRDVYVLDRTSGQVTLESLTPEGRTATADSEHPGISGDGRFLVYQTRGDVVLRDRQEGLTTILAAGREPSISADGRSVVFSAHGEIDRIELPALGVRRIGIDAGGPQASSGASVSPSVSADGRYVAFASTADLDPAAVGKKPDVSVGGLHRAFSQIYVTDTVLGVTTRLGKGAGGRPADGDNWGPVISANGGFVAFVSSATNLVADDRNRSSDVFLADLHSGSVELVSRSSKHGTGNGASRSPALSWDGRFVAFQSEASDLVCSARCGVTDEDINLLWDVFLLDRQTGRMTRVSEDKTGGWMEGSGGPAIDAAGEVVAFSSRHPIDAADTKNDFDLFIALARPETYQSE